MLGDFMNSYPLRQEIFLKQNNVLEIVKRVDSTWNILKSVFNKRELSLMII